MGFSHQIIELVRTEGSSIQTIIVHLLETRVCAIIIYEYTV